MRILVAGGAGYVGSALVPKLVERGYAVDVVDLLWFGNHLPAGVDVIEKDVMDVDRAMLAGYDQVVFLAGLSSDPMAEYSPAMNFVYNAAAPAYLAYTAKQAGVRRFVYASSCSVYGYTANELCDESAPAASSYPYGIAKLQGEAACLQLRDAKFSVISLRKGTICGYSPRMRFDLVVNTMFRTATTEGRIVVDNPAIWRPILAMQDAIAAYVRAIEASDEVSGIFNIASGNYTVGEIADDVKEELDRRLDGTLRLELRNVTDFRNYKVSCEKAIRSLSFKPQHDVAFIVGELFAHRQDFVDTRDPRYYNIEVFKSLDRRRERATATSPA